MYKSNDANTRDARLANIEFTEVTGNLETSELGDHVPTTIDHGVPASQAAKRPKPNPGTAFSEAVSHLAPPLGAKSIRVFLVSTKDFNDERAFAERLEARARDISKNDAAQLEARAGGKKLDVAELLEQARMVARDELLLDRAEDMAKGLVLCTIPQVYCMGKMDARCAGKLLESKATHRAREVKSVRPVVVPHRALPADPRVATAQPLQRRCQTVLQPRQASSPRCQSSLSKTSHQLPHAPS